MAEKKKPARTATPKKPSSAGKGKTAKGKPRQPAAKKQTRAEWEYQRRRMIAAFILFGVTVLCALLYFISGDKLWHSIHQLYRGIFGFFGFLVPGITFYCCWQNGKEEASENYIKKTIYFSFLVLLLSAIVFSFQTDSSALNGYLTEIHNSFILAAEEKGTGAAGAILGIPAAKLLGSVGGGIVCIIAFLILLAVTFDDLTIRLIQSFRRPVRRVGERISDNRQIKQEVTRRKREIDEQQRQKKREEYVRSEIDRRIASHEKKQEDPQLRRIKKTPFYVPDAPEDQRPDKKSKSDKKSAPKPATPVVDDNEPDDIFYTEEDITIPYTEHPEQKEDEIDLPFLPADMPEEVPDSSPAKQLQKSRKSAPAAEENFVVPADSSYYIAGNYVKPPFNLLEPQPADSEANISLELNQNAGMIIETLKSFGVNATIVNISRGPSVTRYELQPAAGVKISKITGLADDIAMSLAAVGVRIEAPIPGKAAVGLEVPNKTVTTVKMRGLVESKEFQEAKSKLTVALGKDIAGKITLADLGKMPHLLIAGSTGSGKSVCINAMLVSLLYKASPDEVKLMLIDPKVVELGVYNGIPHLLVPVVTDPRKAAGALNWAVNEMLNRYKTFAEYNVRDMQGYNRYVDRQNASVGEDPNAEAHTDDNERSFEEDEMLAQAQSELGEGGSNNKKPEKLEKMPHIVIVIDELADLMMAAPKDVEEAICRLAQMARAAGMHLVIATQRPSVDVITGLIKANVPSRIAFAVKTQIDSRTILDTGGAEKLLGKGDMLFSPIGTTKPKRIQGCFVDDSEIENIIEFVKKNKGVEYDESVMEEIERNAVAEAAPKGEESEGDGDSLLEEAIRCVVDAGQASTSMLQRRFRVGYARAGRLIDEMEQMGIIGPHEGAKPRQVLITRQQWMERNVSQDN